MNEWLTQGLRNAATSILWWACVIAATLAAGSYAGQSLGCRRFLGVEEFVLGSLAMPFLALLYPQLFVAFTVTAAAWYFPLRHDSGRLCLVAAIGNFLTWLVVVRSVVANFPALS